MSEMTKFAAWSVRDFEPASLARAWRTATVNPIGSALATAAMVGVPSYLFARPLARGIIQIRGKAMGHTPEQIEQDLAMAESEIPVMRGRLAGALAMMAGGLSLAHNYVPRSVNPEHGGLPSLLTWSPKLEPGTAARYKTTPADVRVASENARMAKAGAEGMRMPSELNALSGHPGVPVKHSLDIIWNDQFMDGRTKITAALPFQNADEGKTGLVSEQDLARGAVRAGFGGAAGYVAGKTLGTVFGAPPPVVQTLSWTGALAGILKNTGVF